MYFHYMHGDRERYTTTLLYVVRAFLFLADFHGFSRIRAKVNENLRGKGMIA